MYLTSLYLEVKNLSNSILNFNFNTQYLDVDYLSVNNIYFNSNIYQFNSYNSDLIFRYGFPVPMSYSISLNKLSFDSIAQLALKIQQLMINVTADPLIQVTEEFITKNNGLRFESLSANTFEFLQNECAKKIGITNFITNTYTTPSNVVITPYNPTLNDMQYIDISSTYLTQNNYICPNGSKNNIPSGLLQRLHLNGERYINENIKTNILIPWNKNKSLTGNIDIRITDKNGNFLDFENSTLTIELNLMKK